MNWLREHTSSLSIKKFHSKCLFKLWDVVVNDCDVNCAIARTSSKLHSTRTADKILWRLGSSCNSLPLALHTPWKENEKKMMFLHKHFAVSNLWGYIQSNKTAQLITLSGRATFSDYVYWRHWQYTKSLVMPVRAHKTQRQFDNTRIHRKLGCGKVLPRPGL